MSKYLLDFHDYSVTQKKSAILFFLNIESCESCVESNLEFLSRFDSKGLTLFLIGHNELLLDRFQLPAHLKIYLDEEQAINRYRTGMGKPLLLRIERGKIISHRFYNSTEVTQFEKDLRVLFK